MTPRSDRPAAGPAGPVDPFAATRAEFELPPGVIYLDGNSLGPPIRAARERVQREISAHWGGRLIGAWNDAGWIDLPARVGARIARLIGAPEDGVTACDSTSVNLYKVLSAALALRPQRPLILSDSGNFPTDLYIARRLAETDGGGSGNGRAGGDGGRRLHLVDPDDVATALDTLGDRVAVLMLTQVDYRSGRLHDIAALTARAHQAGALTVWDLAHSAGALPLDLTGWRVDFAVGCGYKYLNGGPGAPAFVYVRPDHAEAIRPALAGWMGHAEPFAFDIDYRPAPGVERLRVGTPPILSLACLDEALALWERHAVDLDAVRARSVELSQRFVDEVEARCPSLTLASPRDPRRRGSQVSFRFAHEPQHGYAAMQAAIAHGVIGDFRAPDLLRFGFAPLYLGLDDVIAAAEVLETVCRDRLWLRPEYRTRSKVT